MTLALWAAEDSSMCYQNTRYDIYKPSETSGLPHHPQALLPSTGKAPANSDTQEGGLRSTWIPSFYLLALRSLFLCYCEKSRLKQRSVKFIRGSSAPACVYRSPSLPKSRIFQDSKFENSNTIEWSRLPSSSLQPQGTCNNFALLGPLLLHIKQFAKLQSTKNTFGSCETMSTPASMAPRTPAGLRPQRGRTPAADSITPKKKAISERAVWKHVQEGWIDENGNDIRDVKVSARSGFEIEKRIMLPENFSYGEFGEFSNFSQNPRFSNKSHSSINVPDPNLNPAWSDTDITDAIDDLNGPWHNPIWFGNPVKGKFLEDAIVINMPSFATAKEYSSNAAAYAKRKRRSSPLSVPMTFGGARPRNAMQDDTSGAGLSMPMPRPRPTTRIDRSANSGAIPKPKSRPTTRGLTTSELSVLQIRELAKKKEKRAMKLSKTSKNDRVRPSGGTEKLQGTRLGLKRKREETDEESEEGSGSEESSESSESGSGSESGSMGTEEDYSSDEDEDMGDSD
ncbi:hypothetical protein B0J14DRAFT_674505 [Halenospora varia]|nr:hypothetical protein B0J14DRAFT_674505 [Halenospora varia]